MDEVVIELRPLGRFWQVTRDGHLLVSAVTREGAVAQAAPLLRYQLTAPEAAQRLTLLGVTLDELRPHADSLTPRRKGLRVEIELFEQAEAHLQTELVPPDEAAMFEGYQAALAGNEFGRAVDLLVQLGERQQCGSQFWKALGRLTDTVWTTHWMVDRREKGRLEAKIAAIKRRAKR